jgi:hypothetical protein
MLTQRLRHSMQPALPGDGRRGTFEEGRCENTMRRGRVASRMPGIQAGGCSASFLTVESSTFISTPSAERIVMMLL